jgi:hypothetical protein
MTDSTYPNLGFNPVPGLPSDVDAVGRQISTAVDSLAHANDLLGRLRNGNDAVWQGDAGNAFRQHFNDKLAVDLNHAQESLTKAVGVVRDWHTDLVSFKDRAGQLEQEAAAARQRRSEAESSLRQAQANPDLRLAGQSFTDPEQLRQAQARLDAAAAAVRSAGGQVEDAQDALNAIIRRAQDLEDEHHRVADRAAAALKGATDHLAPHKPGMLSRIGHSIANAVSAVGHWVGDHLDEIHSVLSTISAVAGLVALLTPPPIDAIALGVSVVAGAGALAIDLANPEFRHQMGRLFTGHFDKASLGAAMTGVGDTLSVVPGVGVATKAIKGAEVAGEFPRIVEIGSAVAHNPGIPAKLISRVPGVGTALEATRLIEQGAGASTMVTQNMLNILWKGKTVASNAYHDVAEAVH